MRQWRNWMSIWESEKQLYIWELDSDLRIGRRSESYIYESIEYCWILQTRDEPGRGTKRVAPDSDGQEKPEEEEKEPDDEVK